MYVAKDGIIDAARYAAAPRKIAFLLKEVNYENMTADWEYADWLYEQALEVKRDGSPWEYSPHFHKTFANICRWLACIHDPAISYTDCEDYLRHKHFLAQTAVINIHKGGGGASSNWQFISSCAQQNREALMQQIGTIAPDLVICGGTFHFARHDIYQIAEVQRLPCGAEYFCIENTVFLDFVHPAWFSVDRKILFAYFKAVYSELLLLL